MSEPWKQHTHIAHHTANRTRIKLSDRHRNEHDMGRIAQALGASPSVDRVESDSTTGSITIHHKPKALPEIRRVLEDLGVVVMSATELEPPTGAEDHDIASTLTGAISDLDRRLGLGSADLFDLRNLIPAAFGALAVRQLLVYGLQIEAAPWYVLGYLAYDTFVKLHPRPQTRAVQGISGSNDGIGARPSDPASSQSCH